METFTSNPAVFANAELFRRLQGRRVRTVLKVAHMDAGGALHGTSPDGQPVVVRQVVKSEQFSSFVEVVGIVDGDMSLRCEKCTNFGENFDMSNFNSLCRLANGAHQEIFV